MDYHILFVMLVVVTAFGALINDRFLKLPHTIGLTVITIILSLAISCTIDIMPSILEPLHDLLSGVDFKETFLNLMLGYLLFAGAMHTSTSLLQKESKTIIYLASVGVILSTLITGIGLFLITRWFKLALDLESSLVFGALISPTDPVAVLSILKLIPQFSARTRIKIIGEALFNDAAGILLLVTLVQIFYLKGHNYSVPRIGLNLFKEVLGGLMLGFLVGRLSALLIKYTTNKEVDVLITLALSSLGYITAQHLHVSSPITMVIAGLVFSHYYRNHTQAQNGGSKINAIEFWSMVDMVLNAFIFVLIGLEMLTIEFSRKTIFLGIIAFVIVCCSRFISVMIPCSTSLFTKDGRRNIPFKENLILTWAGIRGGISIALALSIANLPNEALAITYIVVVMSIIVQGLSFEWVTKKLVTNS